MGIPLRLMFPETIFSPALLRFYLSPREEVRQTLETKLLNFLRTIVVIGRDVDPSIVFSSLRGSNFDKIGEYCTLLPSIFFDILALFGFSLKIAILLIEDSSTLGAGSKLDTILYLLVILKLVLLLFSLLYKLLILSFEIIPLYSFFYFSSLFLKKFPTIVYYSLEDDI